MKTHSDSRKSRRFPHQKDRGGHSMMKSVFPGSVRRLAARIDLGPEKVEKPFAYCTSWKCNYATGRKLKYLGEVRLHRCPDCGGSVKRRLKKASRKDK